MAARPVAVQAYKKVTMTINGVTKNVVVPVPSQAAQESLDGTLQSDDEECIITEIEEPVASSEDSQVVTVEPDISENRDTDSDTEWHSHMPDSVTIDLTLTPTKSTASYRTSNDTRLGKSTSTVSCQDTAPVSSSATGVVIPMNLNSSTSGTSVHAVVPSATVFRNIAASHPNVTVDSGLNLLEILDLQSQLMSQPYVISPMLPDVSSDPVTKQPLLSSAEASFLTVRSPRTMTQQEANAAGWFASEDRPVTVNRATRHVIPAHSVPVLPKAVSVPLVNNLAVNAAAENRFMPSVEFVSLHNLSLGLDEEPTDVLMSSGSHMEALPVIANTKNLSCHHASETNSVALQNRLLLDMAADRKPQRLANADIKPHCKEKKSDNNDADEDAYNNVRFLGEEDEPLTAVVEGMTVDNSQHGTSTAGKKAKMSTKKTAAMRHCLTEENMLHLSDDAPTLQTCRRKCGRPPKCKFPITGQPPKPESPPKKRGRPPTIKLPDASLATQGVQKARRTGGRPFTAYEQYCLKPCCVWLQQLRLVTSTINTRRPGRKYLCCGQLKPDATGECPVCRTIEKSDVRIQLEVARKFRSGSRICGRAVKRWNEFSIDRDLMAETDISKNMSSATKSPVQTQQTSDIDTAATTSSKENKKYLLIQTETQTFAVPVDSAVGCIVSENEVAKMLSAENVESSCIGEFSKDTLLAACSRSSQGSCSGDAVPDGVTSSESALSSRTNDNVCFDSLPPGRRMAQSQLHSVPSVDAVNNGTKTRNFSKTVTRKGRRRSFARKSITKASPGTRSTWHKRGTFSMMREIKNLGIALPSSLKRWNAKRRRKS